MFDLQEIGPEAYRWVSMSSSQARGLNTKTYSMWLLRLFLAHKLGGRTLQSYSTLFHVKTGGKKNSTP